jgi:hypothetical protein
MPPTALVVDVKPGCSAEVGGTLRQDRWQSRVTAALRVECRARPHDSKVRGAAGVPCPTGGSNPLRSAASSSAADNARPPDARSTDGFPYVVIVCLQR